MRIVFQNLTPASEDLSEEDQALLDATEILLEQRPTIVPHFVTSLPDSPFVAELERRNWEYELVSDGASFVSAAELDALVSRTWSRAKKKFEFDQAKAEAVASKPAKSEANAAAGGTPSASALRDAKRKIAALEASREYRVGRTLLRPAKVVVRALRSSKSKA